MKVRYNSMKGKANIIYVDSTKPLQFENGKKYYKTEFIDEDGVKGYFYTDKILKFGDEVSVKLENSGDSFKFKLSK